MAPTPPPRRVLAGCLALAVLCGGRAAAAPAATPPDTATNFQSPGWIKVGMANHLAAINSEGLFMALKFRTSRNAGLLLHVSGDRGPSYMSLELYQGRLRYLSRLASGRSHVVESPAGTHLDDGRWHQVKIARGWRNGGSAGVIMAAWMTVDDVESPLRAVPAVGSLDFTQVFVAGIPRGHRMRGLHGIFSGAFGALRLARGVVRRGEGGGWVKNADGTAGAARRGSARTGWHAWTLRARSPCN